MAHRSRTAIATLVAATLSTAGCGSNAPKPPTIAGCDAPTGDDRDIAERIVVKELRRLGIVTGEPRLSAFQNIFDGDRIKPDNLHMIAWMGQHEGDRDLAIYGASPGNWVLFLHDRFPKPYSAYRAYCTGWSFADFARTYSLPRWAVVPTPSARS